MGDKTWETNDGTQENCRTPYQPETNAGNKSWEIDGTQETNDGSRKSQADNS